MNLPDRDPVVPIGSIDWNPLPLDVDAGVYPQHVLLSPDQVIGADDMNRVRVGRATYFMGSPNGDGSRYAVLESLET